MTETAIAPTTRGGQTLTPLGQGSLRHVEQASAGVDLGAWVEDLSRAHTIASGVSGTKLVPKEWRGRPEEAAAVILYGKTLGLDPLTSLQNIFEVYGKPAMYARTMQALVIQAGHEIVRTHASEQSVTVKARRRGSNEWQEFTWTIQRAQRAGYTQNRLYQTDPVGMLTAKALAEACRVIAPDVLLGLPYSVEDLELEDLGEIKDTAPKRITRKPKPRPKTEDTAPPVVDEGTGEILDEPATPAEQAPVETIAPIPGDEDKVDGPTMAKIAGLLRDDGANDPAEMRAVVSAFLGREIKSVADLTTTEAARFIAEFKDQGETA